MKLSDHILRKPFYVAFGQAQQGGGITSVDLVAARDATTVTMTASDGSAAPIAGADASTAGVMTAADKSKLDSLPITMARDFATKLDVATSTIGAGITHLRTAGYAAAGDGGAALYKRVGAEPAHALKVQSADLAWWEIVPSNNIIPFQAAGGVEGDTAANGAANVTAFNDFIGYIQTFPAAGSFFVGSITLLFPIGDYHFNTHLNVKATIHMKGAGGWSISAFAGARLHFPADSHGIIVHSSNTTDSTAEVDTFHGMGSVIEGLFLKGGGNTGTNGSGVWMRGRAFVKDCYIREFAEHGLRIDATAGGGGALEGNANSWRVEGVFVTQNGGHGVFVDGADTNAGYALGVDSQSNGRWGIYDSSFLGNTYLQCHTAGNGVATVGGNPSGSSSVVETGGNHYSANAGATEAQLVATTPGTDENVWILIGGGFASSTIPTWLAAQSVGTYFHGGAYHTDNANARGTFIGCYRENDQGINQIEAPSVSYGGIMSANKGTGVSLESSTWSGSMTFSNDETFFATSARDLDLKINPGLNKLLSASATGDGSGGINLVAWDETDKHYLIGEHRNLGSRRPIKITSDLNTITHGRASAQAGGELYLHKGVWIGANSFDARFFAGFRLKPTSGDWARGDVSWNRNPTVPGDPAGWRITTAGTIGAGAVQEEFFYLPDLPADQPGYNVRPKADGSNRVEWREAAKAGAGTIANTASTAAVTFATAFPDANYAVAVSTDGDERVWVTAKTASGFTLNRAGTTGARAVDWTVTLYENL
jgi:hypothetical protein